MPAGSRLAPITRTDPTGKLEVDLLERPFSRPYLAKETVGRRAPCRQRRDQGGVGLDAVDSVVASIRLCLERGPGTHRDQGLRQARPPGWIQRPLQPEPEARPGAGRQLRR